MSYGTITSNGAATAQRCQTSQQESIKNQSKLHYKPQPSKFFQLKNSQNERRQVNLASILTMAMKKKSQIDSVACVNPRVPSRSPADKPTMA